jgi:hypothetical protein
MKNIQGIADGIFLRVETINGVIYLTATSIVIGNYQSVVLEQNSRQ